MRLGTLLDQAVTSHQTPGISLALWQNGREIFAHHSGLANLETQTPVTSSSIFRAGSLTKQLTAALVLKLSDAGKLSLSDPAQQYLPFLSKFEPFTIQELLNHTAGVRDGDYDTTGLSTHSQIELAQRVARQAPFFDFPPGTAWLYSNANYHLVGAILEQVTGKPLAELATGLLFEPFALNHTALDVHREVVVGRASGYTPTGDANKPFENSEFIDVGMIGAAGGLRSTASELCRWHQALLDETLLPPSLFGRLTQPARLRNGRLSNTQRFSENDRLMGNTQYGLGLLLDTATVDGSLLVGHHGGVFGFAAYLASHPATRRTYACVCNVDTHPGLPFRALRREIFADILPPPTP
jgi:CubicO group peptidase (beta-lactamase class C family)